jgi:isopentenyl diphosphate isomerase/L-lactate dehydrogenase-like FMN-dependent dehydrogenase
VVKALALGARAAFAGRPFAAGLAVEGEQGVASVLGLLRAELLLALGLLGCTAPDQIARSHIEPTVPYDPVA